MEWSDVRVLLALLRTKSAHEAAAHLGVDRSTVSRRLAALEASLATRLFVRTRDGLTATPAAERLRALAERMEADASELARIAASAGHEGVKGLVRVATTEALATRLVSQGLLDLRDEHPELEIELLTGNQHVDIARNEADVAVRVSKVAGANLRVRCIARYEIALFAATSYLRTRKGVPNAHALRGHDVLLPAGELRHLPESKWLARQNVRVVLRANSMSALVAAATAGRGIVPLPDGWGAALPGLEQLFVLKQIRQRPLWLVTHGDGAPRPAERVVTEKIVAIFKPS
jgi:DNA-binding transcriptional LysR family regulator